MENPDLRRLVRHAWEVGQGIDLAEVRYGRAHWADQNELSTDSMGYYHTLAGFAVVIKARSALEIGTHSGGSAAAILKGMQVNFADARVVTIDITNESYKFLPRRPEFRQITKFVGDANSLEIIEKVQREWSRVDLLYVDADHVALSTLQNFCSYGMLLQPRVALFDDILLNKEMRRFWDVIRTAFPEHTIDCTTVEPKTRSPASECGFGLWVNPHSRT